MIVMKARCLLTNCHKQMQISSCKHFVQTFSHRVQAINNNIIIYACPYSKFVKMLSDITHKCDFQDQAGAPAEGFRSYTLAQLSSCCDVLSENQIEVYGKTAALLLQSVCLVSFLFFQSQLTIYQHVLLFHQYFCVSLLFSLLKLMFF